MLQYHYLPGLSALPSPPRIRPSPIMRSSAKSLACFTFHMCQIVGYKNALAWFAYVRQVMAITFAWFRTRSTFVGEAPAKRIPAESNRFPTGMFLTRG